MEQRRWSWTILEPARKFVTALMIAVAVLVVLDESGWALGCSLLAVIVLLRAR